MIETLEDIVEDLANKLGIYGAHSEKCDSSICRCCWTSSLRARIEQAVEVDRRLNA